MNKKKLFFVTSEMSANFFLIPYAEYLQRHFDIVVITNSKKINIKKKYKTKISIKTFLFDRDINLFKDLKFLWYLYRYFKKEKPHIVHTINPKCGFIGIFAAWISNVPIRIHTFTGQIWLLKNFFFSKFLQNIDKFISSKATHCLVDSHSQRNFLIKKKILFKNNSSVFGFGSISGVNLKRFKPDFKVRKKIRKKLNISDKSLTFLYLGRIKKDKGILDFAYAFKKALKIDKKLFLLIVGPDEDKILHKIYKILKDNKENLTFVPKTIKPEYFMQASDVFVLPSYREGFGLSVIEAAACGLPSLCSRIYGLKDCSIEGKTGWKHKAGDIQSIFLKLKKILNNLKKIKLYGNQAKHRSIKKFDQKYFLKAKLNLYQKLLKNNNVINN